MIGLKKRIITFDIGGTNLSGGVIEFKKNSYKFLDYFEQKNPKNSKEIKKIFLEKSKEYKKIFKTKKIAISSKKIVDGKRKIIKQAYDFCGQATFSFDFLIERGFLVKIENDGKSFARGEYFFGKGKKNNLLSLTIGTGVGGGFISDGVVFYGAHSSGLETSFLYFNDNGEKKRLGRLSAGRGIQEYFYEITKEKKTAAEIFYLAEINNREALAVIKKAELFLSLAIANLVNLFDPEMIVFGGSISMQKEFIKRSFHDASLLFFNKDAKYKFAISDLGRKANQLGAASLYF